MNRPFAKRYDQPRLSPAEAERQGRASRHAIDSLGGTAAVIAFLNTHDDALGGRPLDIATASEEGLSDVIRLLETRTS
ncbi:antitoxin Xre/MbcA/ParS toxin-binding domain-containing protein [Sphingomonas sp. 1P06PA]|uniref:antitoxin Xre/MbcA/ParS toxin-binding domain-containing protein n=1 Tax=Sphingomonas sp. 1P06PA TaxID=554121 RepID=UPI0039A63E83